MTTDVVIVGAGLAGLGCACELNSRGLSCLLVEASDGVGGRARTDAVDGFLLDRGFQVLLTAYPEAKRLLDYTALGLHSFEPGALIRAGGAFHRVADPWRLPSAMLSTLAAPVGTVADKLSLGKLRHWLISDSGEEKPTPETSTIQYLRNWGFSPAMIDTFFRPFLGGIFLEVDLETSSRMFEFIFRMFSIGEASLPAAGMGAIAQQLAARLPRNVIRLRQRAEKVAPYVVTLASGEEVRAKAVVVATDNVAAAEFITGLRPLDSCGTTGFYFAAEKPPVPDPVLVLNGEGRGPINHLSVPSVVARSYSPSGKHLVSANVVGASQRPVALLLKDVRAQLVEWFGVAANDWQHLRTDSIPHALPEQTPDSGGVRHDDSLVEPGLYVCGDYRETGSINGALLSGRRAAETVSQALGSAAS
jgi:phytoene dehydrogenase-like protein